MSHQDDEVMPYLVLEVANGKTAHRLRPVKSKRYLIGSGVNCHLQVGQDSFPPLHSIILNGPEGAEIELVSSEALLLINGEQKENALLQQDDIIDLGPIRLIVHEQVMNGVIMDQSHHSDAKNEQVQEDAHIVPFPTSEKQDEEVQDQDLSELSAEELIDLIMEEEDQIAEYEKGVKAGFKAMLHEAGITEDQIRLNLEESDAIEKEWSLLRSQLAQIIGHPLKSQKTASTRSSYEDNLNQIALQLHEFAEELEQRSISLANRERECSKATEELLSSQKVLSDQLDYLLQKADELNGAETRKPTRRASA